MLVLAIDTSTPATSVALVDEGGPLAQRSAVAPNRHGEILAPMIAQLLAVAPGSPSAVAAGTGPGPFTGLRVGLVTAAAIAHAQGLPTYPVCSLDALAAAHEPPLVAVTDARRREVYWASYERGARRSGDPQVSTPAELAASLAPAATVVGAGALLYRECFAAQRVLTADPYPKAALIGALAAARIAAGDSGGALVPLYLRRPDAVPRPQR